MIKTYTENGTTYWEVTIRPRSRKNPAIRVFKRQRGITSAAEASRIEKRFVRDAQEQLTASENAGIIWGDLVGKYEMALKDGKATNKKLSPATIADTIRALELYTELWWKRPVSEINRADVLEMLERAEVSGRSNSRQRAILSAINGAIEYGIDHRLVRNVPSSPARGIHVSRIEPTKPEILNRNEIVKFLDAARQCDHQWYPVWAMAVLTGCRSGELYALQWTDIDWDKRLITVSKSYNGRMKTIKSTKAGYWRDVPMNDEAERLLRELRATANGRPEVLPRLTDWTRGEAAKTLRAFLKDIGISSIKFHSLRACFATQLLRDGVPAAVIQKICGWTDLKTMQRYIRLAGIEVDGATRTLRFITPAEAMGQVVDFVRK